MTVHVTTAKPVAKYPTVAASCATSLAASRHQGSAEPIALWVSVTLTVTSNHPAQAMLSVLYPWYPQPDHSVVEGDFFAGLWAQDLGRGVRCQPIESDIPTLTSPTQSGATTYNPTVFGTATFDNVMPRSSVRWIGWWITWPGQKSTVNGVPRTMDPAAAVFRPVVQWNGQPATITYQVSPAVVQCADPDESAAWSAAVVARPATALASGCTRPS
jgi:hypothetical protein